MFYFLIEILNMGTNRLTKKQTLEIRDNTGNSVIIILGKYLNCLGL